MIFKQTLNFSERGEAKLAYLVSARKRRYFRWTCVENSHLQK